MVNGTEMFMSLRHHGQISVSLHRHVTSNTQGDCSYTADPIRYHVVHNLPPQKIRATFHGWLADD